MEDSQKLQFYFSLPIHAAFSYSALRRKSVAWKGSMGLGVNSGYRPEYKGISVAPSSIFEVMYAPTYIYGLRVMMDVTPA